MNGGSKREEENVFLLSPLEQSKHSNQEEEIEGATAYQTSINLSKTCMGTGILALPYAASQGGLLFNIIGLGIISLWNSYSINCLIQCSNLIDDDLIQDEECDSSNRKPICCRYSYNHHPPTGTSTLGKVAWYSFGPFGLYFLDIMMIILFSGVVISYEEAAISFLQKTSISSESKCLEAIYTMIFIIPLACLKNVGFLSNYSALGILVIILSFLVIYSYGIEQNGWNGMSTLTMYDLYPQSINECSTWFGIIVFSYGIVPFTYNMQESMKDPTQMKYATTIALWMVFIIYIVVSNGVFIIYAPSLSSNGDKHFFNGDVLQHLPSDGMIPTLIRYAMVCVIIVTAPLIIIPCSELLEGKLLVQQTSSITFYYLRIFLRVMICVTCTCISILLPNFVSIVSFIGCFSVAFVSFIIPPLFYVVLNRKLLLLQRNEHNYEQNTIDNLSGCSYQSIVTTNVKSASFPPSSSMDCNKIDHGSEHVVAWLIRYHLFDCCMVLLGILATVTTTYLTFQDLKK